MLVELRGVSKRFGDRLAVDGLDLDVPGGGCFGLLGPNGAGKTTTLRMVYGVTRPTTGTVRVFGLDVTRETRAVRARIGVTLQENVFIDAISPVDNLRVFGRYHLLREPVLSQRIEELLDFLELRSHASVPVKALSGGFKRRLAVLYTDDAAALVAQLRGRDQGDRRALVVRPTNLEDVFLALTGTSLEG